MLRRVATAAVATAALALAARAQSSFPVPSGGGPVDVEADRIVYDWEAQVLQLEGHVVARRDGAILRAGSGSLDRAHGVLTLKGGVLGVQGRQVFLADAAIVDLNARSAELGKAVLYLKERPANPDQPRAGANALTLRGERVQRRGDGAYVAQHVTLTPCDCAGDPDYELLADTAEVEGDRAHLHGVDVRFLHATIPFFPLSLPLTSRQSGLLAPTWGFGPAIGFTLLQPVYFTLGSSNDITLTPGFYTGGTTHTEAPNSRAVKGPRLGFEWRYAPVEGTSGALSFDSYYDLDQHDSAPHPAAYPGERGTSGGRGLEGVRGVAHFLHRTNGDAIFAVDATAATDILATRDPQPYALESLQDFLRTDVGLWRARGPFTWGADATLMQDLRLDAAAPDRRLFGFERRSTMQRLPAAFLQLAPVPLGPALVEVEASAVQFDRFVSAGPQERETGFGPTDLGASASLPTPGYDASKAPALRFDVSPRVVVSGPASLPLELRLEAGARADAWVFEGFPDRDRTRLYALLGLSAGLPLERRYGDTLHRVRPAFAVRALSRPLQSGGPPVGDPTDAGGSTYASAPDAAQQGLPPGQGIGGVPAARRAYDEIDFAAPASGAVEAVASLSQSLWVKRGPVPSRILQFDLVQDALLWADGARARLGEGSALFGVQLGPASLGGGVRYDWRMHALSALSAGGNVRDARTDELHAGIGLLRASGVERVRAGIDELFAAARFDIPPSPLTGSAGTGLSGPLFWGLRLGYDVTHTFNAPPGLENWRHATVLSYDTPCKCASMQLALAWSFHDGEKLGPAGWRPTTFAFRLDLKSLGSFSTF